MRKCGWAWGGLGAPGFAGEIGLYIGSDVRNIRVAERDILHSTNASDIFKHTFTTQKAPHTHELLAAMGYSTSAHDQGSMIGFKQQLTAEYTLKTGCSRAPYGRWHSQAMDSVTRQQAFTSTKEFHGRSVHTLSNLGDEAIFAYCNTIGDDSTYVACQDDPYSYDERRKWCESHPQWGVLHAGFVLEIAKSC